MLSLFLKHLCFLCFVLHTDDGCKIAANILVNNKKFITRGG